MDDQHCDSPQDDDEYGDILGPACDDGLDNDNDGKIDKWTGWQQVKEAYDYIPGFSKQVKRTPASLDLSSLPEGYGFQFEVKLTDTTENKSKPILESVELRFKD